MSQSIYRMFRLSSFLATCARKRTTTAAIWGEGKRISWLLQPSGRERLLLSRGRATATRPRGNRQQPSPARRKRVWCAICSWRGNCCQIAANRRQLARALTGKVRQPRRPITGRRATRPSSSLFDSAKCVFARFLVVLPDEGVRLLCSRPSEISEDVAPKKKEIKMLFPKQPKSGQRRGSSVFTPYLFTWIIRHTCDWGSRGSVRLSETH